VVFKKVMASSINHHGRLQSVCIKGSPAKPLHVNENLYVTIRRGNGLHARCLLSPSSLSMVLRAQSEMTELMNTERTPPGLQECNSPRTIPLNAIQ